MNFLESTKNTLKINKGFINNMQISPVIYANSELAKPLYIEYENRNIMSALTQLANIATLPGIKAVYGLPDIHCGYGFPIGSVAGFDINTGIISPGGVGYDINCGVRSSVTNLMVEDFAGKEDEIAELLFNTIPTGMGGISGMGKDNNMNFELNDINDILENGLDSLVKRKLIKDSDIFLVEKRGRMAGNSRLIGQKAKARGLNQIASLGSGNHYLEVQYVDKIFDREKAKVMGIYKEKQILVTIHTGSRGLGHQVCNDFLLKMNMEEIEGLCDRQLAYAPINSNLGKDYFDAMSSAANFAFTNRALIDKLAGNALSKIFREVETNLIYDVSHNIAKKEVHSVNYELQELMVHRKGATRSFPPFHPCIPEKYKFIGQPVLVGGSMGTSSYILAGDYNSMQISLGSSCHGAGRLLSRTQSQQTYGSENVMNDLKNQGITIRCASERGLIEEAPGAYKDVDVVADLCEEIGITKKVCQVKPFIVIKG